MRVPARTALLLLLAGLAVAAAGPAAAPAAGQPDLPPQRLQFGIALQSDGDARWRIVTRLNLSDASDRRAFENLARRFVAPDAEVGYGVETFRRSASRAEQATGRSMRITNVSRHNETTAGVGRLVLSFTWTNFGVTESANGTRTLRVGDAFDTPRSWFPGLPPNTTLVVEPPPGYTIFDAPKPIEQGAIVYRGPANFEPADLRFVFRRTDTPTDGSGGTNGGTDGGTPSPTGRFDTSTLLFVGAVLIGLGAVGAGAYLRRETGTDGPATGAGGNGGTPSGGGPSTGVDQAVTPVDGTDGPDNPDAGAGGGAGTGGEPGEEEEKGIDFDLLSDEERVEYLLERNGGRMKQADIVSETGWSNAKVSQLLSSMAEEDRVDKLRIGRENLISLPDEDVTDILDDK